MTSEPPSEILTAHCVTALCIDTTDVSVVTCDLRPQLPFPLVLVSRCLPVAIFSHSQSPAIDFVAIFSHLPAINFSRLPCHHLQLHPSDRLRLPPVVSLEPFLIYLLPFPAIAVAGLLPIARYLSRPRCRRLVSSPCAVSRLHAAPCRRP